ncbi:hypothetical protein [Lutibacter sp.]|uniref:hypothetical protein n=1 Tax=Lutibacter sp. TaxID=1925666 RepID=UPI002733B2CB|nr:hypothetical protein [Lutibacter sp.]MDP3313202.1 hypothetical protein [Lutibacter sp.]
MKNQIIKLKILLLLVSISFFAVNCSNDNDDAEPISSEETIALVEIDDIADDVSSVVDDYFATEGLAGKTENSDAGGLDCVTKTIVLTSTSKTVTLDFGTGCTLPNGNVLSGKIIMSFAIDTTTPTITITSTYDNFYFNDLRVEGENTIVKVRQNENGKPQSTVNYDVKVTWPNGDFATRKGTKIRVWIAGFGTRGLGDDIFLITGNWSSTHKNGNVFSVKVLEPLRREMACRFIVSGIIEINKNGSIGTLNFGDGSCDDKAVFTNSTGEEKEITLRKRFK